MDQFQPQVAVAPNGRVSVMWFDRRLPCPDLPWITAEHVGRANMCIDTFLTRSFDDGLTWQSNIRASAQTWDWTLNLPMVDQATGFKTRNMLVVPVRDEEGAIRGVLQVLNRKMDNFTESDKDLLGDLADQVAQALVRGIERRQPYILPTFDARLYFWLANGVVRLLHWYMDGVVARVSKERKA